MPTFPRRPNVDGPVLTPTRNRGSSGAWRLIIIIIYLVCLLVGTASLFAFATIGATFAATPLGQFGSDIARALLAAGVIGLAVELLAREASRREQEDALWRLRDLYSDDLTKAFGNLQEEIARTPLQLDRSVDLLSEDRRIDVVRKIFSDSVDSTDVGDAILKTVRSAIGDKDRVWRETSHVVQFQEEEVLSNHGLVRIVDQISYKAELHRNRFYVGILRGREIHRMLRDSHPELDAFWLTPKAFPEGTDECLADFRDFEISTGDEVFRPSQKIRTLEDGSRLFEYDLPDHFVGCECRLQYTFAVVADLAGPYLHIAVPCPSVGLHILLRNYVRTYTRFEDRMFVPDPTDVTRHVLNDDVLEIRTQQVILRGHGGVILLR